MRVGYQEMVDLVVKIGELRLHRRRVGVLRLHRLLHRMFQSEKRRFVYFFRFALLMFNFFFNFWTTFEGWKIFFVYLQKPNGPKTRPPKVSKCSSSVQEDIEIEIAEVLYGLKKQSHGSKKEEKAENDLQKLDSTDANDSKSSPNSNFAQTSILNQNNASASDSLLVLGGYIYLPGQIVEMDIL
jgi:hypothetical protein